ncbi:MAG: hypothetical protein AAGA10_25100 [Bacteroidota bacterium]
MKKICLLWMTIGLVYSSFGQGINYQAVARTIDGELLVEQAILAEMVIYDGSSSPIYSEIHTITTNKFGLFSMVVGQGQTLLGDFLDIDWSQGGHKLGVSLDIGNGSFEVGRSDLQSVPYSFFAQEAGSVRELSLSDLDDVDGTSPSDGEVLKWDASQRQWTFASDNVSDGSGASVNTSARIEGDGSTDAPLDIASQGASVGQVLGWDGSTWRPATLNAANFQAGEGIAIDSGTISNTGDTNPNDDLTQSSTASGDVGGTFDNLLVRGLVGRPISTVLPLAGQFLKYDGNSWRADSIQPGTPSPWQFNGANIFSNNDRVGVGTSNPVSKFHVSGGDVTISDNIPLLALNGSQSNKIIRFQQGDVNQADIFYSNGTGLRAVIDSDPTRNWILNTNGNFGIGTTTAASKLHVAGDILVQDDIPVLTLSGSQSNKIIQFRQGNTDQAMILYSNNFGLRAIMNNDPSRNWVLNTSGDFGIGTNSPESKLHVSGDIRTDSEVHSNRTGTANLVPICYGYVSSNGTTSRGSDNFASKRVDLGEYEIQIEGEGNFVFDEYIVVVSLSGEAGFSSYSSDNGNLVVRTYAISDAKPTDRDFSFVVYKP